MTTRSYARVPMAAVLIVAVVAGLGGVGAARADEELKNLKVFPSTITKRELTDTMRQWSLALGVRCDFCHEQKVPGDPQSFDFASDKIGHKEVARRMFAMVRDLNGGPLPRAAGEPDAAVSCVTCHHGLPSPTTLDRVLLNTVHEQGTDAGLKKYRELRDRYYGTGAFDFGPGSLQAVTAALASDQKGLEAALAFGRLNVEMNPKFADGFVDIAQILELGQDRAGALAALDQALRLEPENRHAQRLKQKLGQ